MTHKASLEKCYGYNATAGWTVVGRLSAVGTHRGYSMHPSLGLIASGGIQNSFAAVADVWSTTDGANFRADHKPVRLCWKL